MTPWTWTNVPLLVSVALGLFAPSAQGHCNLFYFSWSHYGNHLNTIVPFVEASNLKDSMECSAERGCLKEKRTNESDFIPLLNCFGRDIKEKCTETSKCTALKSNRNIDYYHFLCLTAEALEINITSHEYLGCAHDYICSIIQNLPRADQTTKQPPTTTTPPPTTTPSTTTTTSTTTSATVKATTLPERTTSAPTMSQPGSQPTTTSGTAHSQSQMKDANSSAASEQVETNQQAVLLIVLVVVLVILLVMSFLYIIHLKRQLHALPLKDGLVLTPAEVQPMAEMKPHVCHCVAIGIAE